MFHPPYALYVNGLLALSLGNHIEDNGCQKNEALYDSLVVGVYAHDGHAQVDNAHQHGSDDDAGNRSDSAVRGSAADKAGSDSVHLIVLSVSGLGGGHAGDGQHACQGSQKAHVRISDEIYLIRIDTGKLRRLLVSSYRVEVAARGRHGGDIAVNQDDYDDPYQSGRNALVQGQVVGEPQKHGAEHDHLCQHGVEGAGLIAFFLTCKVSPELGQGENRAGNHAGQHTGDIEAVSAEEIGNVAVSAAAEDFYKSLIAELRIQGNIGNGEAYLNSYHSLKNFNKGKALNYTFGYIDQRFLKKYENWMRNKGLKETTLSFQFRTLRAIFNKAIEEKIVSPDKNPFPTFKISKFSIKTQKRALSKEDITKIITTESINSTPIRTLARHIFIFSYLCGGISFVDIANLKMENIQRGRLHYQRQKTHGEINLKINDIALSIIQYYKAHQIKASYLFPILDATKHKTPMQKKNRVHKVCAQVNKELRNLAKELNINAPITTYWARHSFATILKKSGVNISIISEALGHHDIQTTQIYLDSFENEQVDAAMKNLL